MADHTTPDDATLEAEQHDAQASADAGPMPSPEEEAAADAGVPVSDEVRANEEHMRKMGANIEGEGRVG